MSIDKINDHESICGGDRDPSIMSEGKISTVQDAFPLLILCDPFAIENSPEYRDVLGTGPIQMKTTTTKSSCLRVI